MPLGTAMSRVMKADLPSSNEQGIKILGHSLDKDFSTTSIRAEGEKKTEYTLKE